MSSKRKYSQSAARRRRTRKNGHKWKRCVLTISGAAIFILLLCGVISFVWGRKTKQTANDTKKLPKITIDTKLIQKNKYSRPGIELKEVNGVVIHYTANPKTDAIDNRNYFNNLPKSNKGKVNPVYASSHFVIGLEGQIVQCIPLNEMAYASNDRNTDTIAIECCHPDDSGKFNQLTYRALIELTAYLCIRFDLDENDVIRHYDVTGKQCPRYFVQNEDKWEIFRDDVKLAINGLL